MGKEEDIFSDEFEQKKNDIEHSDSTPPPPDDKKPEKKDDFYKDLNKKTSKKKPAILGVIVIGIIITMAYFLFIEYALGEPFDASNCHFGVKSELFTTRCMTEQEQNIFETLNPPPVKPTVTPKQDDTPFKDISSATDKVEVSKTKEPIGYYLVTTTDDWYGDFVDFRKVPSKIEKSESMKVSFRCFTDEFQGTSTYFGTFRNVIDPNLTVEVYINGIEVESQTTTINKALILEGSCYGHES